MMNLMNIYWLNFLGNIERLWMKSASVAGAVVQVLLVAVVITAKMPPILPQLLA